MGLVESLLFIHKVLSIVNDARPKSRTTRAGRYKKKKKKNDFETSRTRGNRRHKNKQISSSYVVYDIP